MDELLRKLGLTEGEIKVYLALLPLGQSRVDAIMKATAVSSSKVYLILERLVSKGLVSKITKNGVLHFEADTPEKLISYSTEKMNEISTLQDSLRTHLQEFKDLRKTTTEPSATVYDGWEGLKTFFLSLLDDMHKGDEVRYFTISFDELTYKSTKTMLENFNAKRSDAEIGMRVITDNTSTFKTLKRTHTQLKLAPFDVPDNTMIFGDCIALLTFIEHPHVMVIRNARIAKSYATYFDSVWKKIGK